MRVWYGFLITILISVPGNAQTSPRTPLADLIAEALAKNPDIVAAQKRYDAARQRPAQERSFPDPMVSAGYNASGNPLPGAGLGTEPIANIGVMVSQELPYPGKRDLRASIASREADAEFQHIDAARLTITARVKQAYYRLAYAHAVTGVLTRNRELLDTLLEVSEGRYAVGKAAQQDVIKAQTQVSILELQLERVRQERAAREGELNALLNRPATASIGRPEELQLTAFEGSLDALLVAANQHAPMLRRDQLMIERSQLAVDAARKEYKPDFAVTAGYFYMGAMPPMYERYYVKSVPGVAEVAPLGGFVRQYQVQVDPNRLRAFNIPISKVIDAVRAGNNDVGGRLVEMTGAEYMVRGRGYAKSMADIGDIVLARNDSGVPVRVRDVGAVSLGPDLRRGVADLDGTGDVVAGIVVMRQGENALHVIERVKAKLADLEPTLPTGVKVVTAYDRSELILRSIENLKRTLIEELLIVSAIVLIFLWHIPSALIPIITIPVAVAISFIPMRMMGVTSNIMSLGGIAIAVGAMVDAAIVVGEQTHKKLELWDRTGRKEDYHRVVVNAVKEVGGPSFFALLVIAVSFLPVLTLEAQEGRLFRPLAYTKNFSMIIAAVLAITLDPAMRLLFTHMKNFSFKPAWLARVANAVLVGKIHSEETHPISRILIRAYEPICRWSLRWKWLVLAGAAAIVVATVPVYQRLGSEFMPPLDEGSLLYMPSTLPGISVTEAQRLLQVQDRIIKQFPEVERVLGKAGRAETSTDPAPFSMMETVITLKPHDQWRHVETWYSDWAPEWLKPVLRRITSDRLSTEQLVQEMNEALKLPGTTNAWTMPIKARTDMLTTGVRTPVGIKIYGSNIHEIERIGTKIESVLPGVFGTRSAFAERTSGGYFVDFDWKRDELARYGLSIDDAQMVVMSAVGGDTVTTTVEGRERYPVNVRYFRDYRSDVDRLRRVVVPAMDGRMQVPVSQLANVKLVSGPAMLRDENGMLNGYVYVDVAGRDIGSYVTEAKRVVAERVKLPAGYSLVWSGQYEAMQRVRERLKIVLPVTVFLVLMLLYLNTRSLAKTSIIVLAVPFSAVGAIWLLYMLGYNMSIGVWVGLIALVGVDAETGVFMLLYLELAYDEATREGRLNSVGDLQTAILHGAVKRIRPKFMTVATMFLGLVPIMWSAGTGADVMKRIAAPMIGGIFTSFILELLVYPAIYEIWKWHFGLKRELALAMSQG